MKNNDDKENKIRLIKIGIYIGIIIILIIVIRLSNASFQGVSSNNYNKSNNNLKIIENIKNINNNYYSEKIHMTLDDDAITLNYEKVSEIETGIKKYHSDETEYVKHNNTYYTLENGEFKKINNFIDFNYDKTFSKLENIQKLLELEPYSSTTHKSENLDVIKNTYTIQNILKIYNEYNNTDIIKFTDGYITVEIYYTENNLEYMIMDITDFYNFLNDTTYNEVKYKIEIKENKEEDISWILEKLN